MDERLIFNRREPVAVDEKTLMPENIYKYIADNEVLHSIIYIGSNMVHILASKNKICTHFDMQNYKELDSNSSYIEKAYFTFNDGKRMKIISEFTHYGNTFSDLMKTDRKTDTLNMEGFDYVHGYDKEFPKITQWNELYEIPILLVQKFSDESAVRHRRTNFRGIRKRIFVNPPLNKMGIYIDADWVWQSLSEFLLMLKTQKEISPEISNEGKILSRGFDNKSSFRPKMKNK
ncbi:MAG: hypothetical protein Q4D53_01835 [Leptotrichiaceae bacterium]|nr:hypothetical protein [Leptotrichiaceae bacterium]